MTYINGDVYNGDWMDHKKNGKGKMTYINGDIYDGEWLNNLKQGNCLYLYKNGSKLNGEIKKGLFYGTGKKIYENGDIYEGEFINGMRSRKGKYILYANNHILYDGDWLNNIFNGSGIISYTSGKRYEGEFVNGKRYNGIYLNQDGTSLCGGYWKDNSHYNKVRKISKDGSIHQQEFINGMLIKNIHINTNTEENYDYDDIDEKEHILENHNIKECSICQDNKMCNKYECNHYTCNDCIEKIKTKIVTCPLCRKELFINISVPTLFVN